MITTFNAEIAFDFVHYLDYPFFLTGDVAIDFADGIVSVKIVSNLIPNGIYVPVENVTPIDLAVALV